MIELAYQNAQNDVIVQLLYQVISDAGSAVILAV